VLGYSGSVSIACPGNLPPGFACSVSPATVTLNSAPVTSTVTITTVAPTTLVLLNPELGPTRSRWLIFLAAGGFAALGIFFLIGSDRGWKAVLGLLFISATLWGCTAGLAGKGGGGSTMVPSTLTLGSSNTRVPNGSPVTLKAFVAASKDVTGTVTFTEGGAQIDQPVTLTAGRALLTTSALNTVGTHAISASYSGDSSTQASSSASPLEQVITGLVNLQLQTTSGTLSHALSIKITIQ
jgi:hypothetical protein